MIDFKGLREENLIDFYLEYPEEFHNLTASEITLIKICEICGKVFGKRATCSRQKWNKQKFCSSKCVSKFLSSKQHSEKVYKGKVIFTLEKIDKLLAGITEGSSWAYIRKVIAFRDDFTCQHCGNREVEVLEVDHILPKYLYPELKRDVNNLITLCANCHRKKTDKEMRSRGLKQKTSLAEFAEKIKKAKQYSKLG
jgi:hypothetical protein